MSKLTGELIYIIVLVSFSVVFAILCKKIYLKILLRKAKPLFKAYELFDRGRYHESIFEAEKLVKTKIAPLAYEHVGNCHLELGNKSEASAAFKKALSLDNELADSYVGIGKIMLEGSNIVEAIDNFNSSLSLIPQNTVAKYYLALAYEEKGDYESAIKELTEAKAINPTVEAIYDRLNEIYLYLGKISEAEDIIKAKQLLKGRGN